MKIIVLFVNFLTIFNMSTSLNIECSYVIHNYPHIQLISCCHVVNNLNIEFPDKALIKFVSGTKSEKDETIGFRIYNKTTQYFPRGLENDFENLKVIEISHGHLRDIRRDDLNPFELLEVLYLYSNDIEILEEGLFDNNVNLKFITLSENKIIHIDKNAFDNLHRLTDLYLNRNDCVDLQADNLHPLENVINITKNICNDENYIILYRNTIALEETKNNLKLEDFSTFYKNLTNLDNLIKASKFKKSSIRKRIYELRDWSFEVLWSDVSNFNKFLARFNTTVLERLDILEQNLLKQESEINNNHAEVSQTTENVNLDLEKLEEVQHSQINESAPPQNQLHKKDEKYASWEAASKFTLVLIGFCLASLLFLTIVLIKRYFFNYQIISYKVADSSRYDN